jgi:hypothetical protein
MRAKWTRYRKFIVAALAAAAVAAQGYFSDEVITPNEWWKIAFAAVGAVGVYFVRNDQPARNRRDLAAHLSPERPRRTDLPGAP